MEAFISQQPAYDKQLPRNCNARRALNSQHRESFPISNTFMMIWYTDNQWLSGQLPHFLLNLEKWKPVTREMLPLVVLDQKYNIDITSVSRIRCGTEIYGDFIYSCIYLHKWPTEPNAQLWAKQLKKKKKNILCWCHVERHCGKRPRLRGSQMLGWWGEEVALGRKCWPQAYSQSDSPGYGSFPVTIRRLCLWWRIDI